LRAALPFALTALVAVALSFAIQAAWLQPAQPAILVPTNLPAARATAVPTPRAIPTAPTAPPLSQNITRQDLIVQMDDAVGQLRTNEFASVDQSLVAIDNTLQLAYARYERAGDSARDAVAQRRMEVGKLHDDLYLYPEGMDQRLSTLRQLTLALITEQQQ
jgi:hypothetical protein